MSDTRCNGWANYATWRVHLELLGDMDWEDQHYDSLDTFARALEDEVDEILTNYGSIPDDSLALNYARSFVNAVDWYELAEHYAADNPGLVEDEDDDDLPLVS